MGGALGAGVKSPGQVSPEQSKRAQASPFRGVAGVERGRALSAADGVGVGQLR